MPKTLNKYIIIMSKQMLNYLPVSCARSSLANSTYHSKDKTIDKSCALMICIPTSVALSCPGLLTSQNSSKSCRIVHIHSLFGNNRNWDVTLLNIPAVQVLVSKLLQCIQENSSGFSTCCCSFSGYEKDT